MNDSISADDGYISRDWAPFAEKLAAVLAKLREDQFLVILVKRTNRYVQFAAQGGFGLRAETTADAFSPKSEYLTKEQIAALIGLGWNPPTGAPAQSTPEKDPDGSPNFFVDYPAPVPFDSVADQAMRTLAHVLRIPYPGMLAYEAFDAEGNQIPLPQLGLKRLERDGEVNLGELADQLIACVEEATGLENLQFDGDGDIAIECGSATVFIRLHGEPVYVRFYSPLVEEVDESPRLLARLNELNSGVGRMHFLHRLHIIFLIMEIPALPMAVDHIVSGLKQFCEVADGIDAWLEAEFGENSANFLSAPAGPVH